MKNSIFFLFAFTVFLSTTVFGEGAASIADGLVNKSGIAPDQALPDKGREYALEAAGRDTNTGAGVAGATGAALTGAATAHFLMGDWITGGTLMSMAAMEFAQMAASGAASRQHGYDRSVLTNQYTSNTTNSPTNPENQMNNRPELPANFENWLKKSGLDPVDFKEALFNGRLNDPQAVLNALGRDTSSITSEELDKARQKAEAEFGKISSEVQASMGSQIGMLNGSQDSKNSSKSILDKEKKEDHPDVAKSGAKTENSLPTSDVDPAASQNFLNGLFGAPTAGGLSSQDQNLLFESYLKDQGLVPVRPGMNIFQVAQQNYRSYARWRSKTKSPKRQITSVN